MRLQIQQTIGFTLEILTFILTGMFLMKGLYIYAFVVLTMAMGLAVWVGQLIKEIAIEEFRSKEHGN